MVDCSRNGVPKWMPAATSVEFDGAASANAPKSSDSHSASSPQSPSASGIGSASSDSQTGFGERALSAAGASVISVVLVNPLDVAKTRLQAQAAGVAYYPMQHQYERRFASLGPSTMFSNLRGSSSCTRAAIFGTELVCPPDCFQYKGTMDVINKVVRQEGFARLWRGTSASLALAVPTVGIYLPCYDIFRNWIEEFTVCSAPILTPYVPLFAGTLARSLACISCSPIELARTRMQAYKEMRPGMKPPGIWKTLGGVLSSSRTNDNHNLRGYRVLWTGMGAQLARDVPFSAICWPTLEPIRRRLLLLAGDEGNVASVLGANFSAGFAAGSIAAFATCPLDVVKTRRQIEKDPSRALNMTTIRTLGEVWRTGGLEGLFTGVGPRVGRAGPSVGIVVSFYEVVKYVLHQRNADS